MVAEHNAGTGGQTTGTKPVEIFYSYSHKDEDLRDELEKHLALLRQQGLLALWYDRKIEAGADRANEIITHLTSADIILLLISADFLASDYCTGIEMKRALERHKAGEAVVIPILLRPCDWETSQFAQLQVLPSNAVPVTSWNNTDEAFTDIARGLRKTVTARALNKKHQESVNWNVPFARNPFFTGRAGVLKRLHDALSKNGTAALSQPAAISGLGGIGKTQTAVEYAYRHRDEYRYVFWLRSETASGLAADYATIAELLNLPEGNQPNQDLKVAAAKRWLQANTGWLLIFDNADNTSLVQPYLPTNSKGHVILTTRTQSPGRIAQKIEIEQMEPYEGAIFLLHRAAFLPTNSPIGHAPPETRAKALEIARELDGLPLALEQAASYIDQTYCGLEGYLQRYHTQRTALLKHNPSNPDYNKTVATTWNLSFKDVEVANPAAADLLRLCAFLSPDAIPEEIITEGAVHLGPTLKPLSDSLQLDAAIHELRKYSLIKRDPDEHLLSIHRLVQAVLLDQIPKRQQRMWIERAIRAVNEVFPNVEFTNWPQCQRLLPQAQACAALIEQYNLLFREASLLISKAGRYLREQGQYAQAQPLYQGALDIDEQISGSEHRDTAASLNNLAFLYYRQGQYEQAEPLLLRSLKIKEQMHDSDDLDTAAVLDNLGQLYMVQGHYEQAEQYYRRALNILERILGEHPDTAITLNNLANLYRVQGKYDQAEQLFLRDLAISEKALGPDHPENATTLDNLGQLYHDQSHYEQAEQYYQRALDIKERVLGEHPDTAITLFNLGMHYKEQGHYEQAESLYQRALAIDEKAFGPEHREVARDLEEYADLLRKMGRTKEAEKMEERARKIWEKWEGSDG